MLNAEVAPPIIKDHLFQICIHDQLTIVAELRRSLNVCLQALSKSTDGCHVQVIEGQGGPAQCHWESSLAAQKAVAQLH